VVAICCLAVTTLAVGAAARADGAPDHHHRIGRTSGHVKAFPRTSATATVTTTREVVGRANFQVGYDYTQNEHLSAGAGGSAPAVASAKKLLASLDAFQNVALMGWGADDPEPSPGHYDWSSLDSRIEVMGATTSESQRMITLCTAPGWMKVGGASQEWNMDAAVAPAHFQDFAALAAEVAERYDGTHKGVDGQILPRVDYFDVWNELKGFWSTAENTWDYQDYTEMYNDVYRAIMAVRPDARIGGPYAPVGAGTASSTADPSSIRGGYGVVDQRALNAVSYWLQHKVGAQFVSFAGGPAATDENGFASGQYFVAVTDWLRGLDDQTYPGATTLPILWAEFYPGIDSTAGDATGQASVAIDVSNIVQAGSAGVGYLLLWEMEGSASGGSPTTGEGVWTDTAETAGGRPTPLFTALDELHKAFPPGTAEYGATVTGPVSVLAGRHHVLLVSHSPDALDVDVNHLRVRMDPYAVTVVTTRT
jgi:hypothetical protein